ncbi:thioredoxin family protein [Desertibacillus haloalkaliphilus]|uniref:thioredoxin family protein n=1 Tax=Desertibacillus haloalkaliphilus TaxID=1328930 RepID=UPI001C26524C|nr:thioredoxin family protein [Desertibacillus haloalkaliphilus]MBU8905231.1 thioredoxin family protein [Desertibacillus haloalkaliphilus]
MKTLESISMYDEVIKEGQTVMMFSADWCPDCRVIEPILPEIEAVFPEVTFLYADRDEFIDLCSRLDVFGIPSFIFYRDGQEVHRFVSKDRKTKEEIVAFIREAEAK